MGFKKYNILGFLILIFILPHIVAENKSDEMFISKHMLTSFQERFIKIKDSRDSTTRRRRGYKNIIREAEALIKKKPNANNRFILLNTLLKVQIQLLKLDKTQRNKESVYKTCKTILNAPDEYREIKLNAEFLLMTIKLDLKNADINERISSLKKILEGYRNTSFELDCLMRIIKIAESIRAYELKDEIMNILSTRFNGNLKAISFLRKLNPGAKRDLIFSGKFKRLDSSEIIFPHDRLGHPYIVVFWSKNSPDVIEKLKRLHKNQIEKPNIYEIYSLNLDELTDGGKSIIESIGLDCTVLHLPKGKKNEVFKAYGADRTFALRVNQLGFTRASPLNEIGRQKNKPKKEKFRLIDDFSFPVTDQYLVATNEFDRYASQLRSFIIGDFLVLADQQTIILNDKNKTAKLYNKIKQCFIKAPFRYRINKKTEFSQYQKAYKISIKALEDVNISKEHWRILECRIISLMGMANLSGDSKYYHEAVQEAHKLIALEPSSHSSISAHYCIAMFEIRNQLKPIEVIIDDFLTKSMTQDNKFLCYSSVCVLAIASGSKEMYAKKLPKFLDLKKWPMELDHVARFFRDRYHNYYLFKVSPNFQKYNRFYRFVEQNHLINNNITQMLEPLPRFEIKTLDGKIISLPESKAQNLSVLVFIEPSAGKNGFTTQIYNRPQAPTKHRPNPKKRGELGLAFEVADSHTTKGVKIIPIVLSEDIGLVKSIIEKYNISKDFFILPGGLSNPIVNRLGLLSADRYANVLLLRRNGTIAWSKHGLPYQSIGKYRYNVSNNGLRHHIIACDAEAGYFALKNKSYQNALIYFQENLNHTPEGNSKWNSTLAHGRALSHLALKEYDKAMLEIENAIKIHSHTSQGRWPKPWEFNHNPKEPCSSMIHMLNTKIKICAHLGRKIEAKNAKNTILNGAKDYPTDYDRLQGFHKPYEIFEDRMREISKEIN